MPPPTRHQKNYADSTKHFALLVQQQLATNASTHPRPDRSFLEPLILSFLSFGAVFLHA
jgi:hypothetical protein